MTNSPEASPSAFRQLEDEVHAVYSMLTGVAGTQRRHGNRLDETSADVWRLRPDVAAVTADVNELKAKVTALDAKLDRVLALLER